MGENKNSRLYRFSVKNFENKGDESDLFTSFFAIV